MCINNNISARYLTTTHTCIYFDISDDFLLDNKRDGVFVEGIHYAQPSTKMLRWNIPALEQWFGFNTQDYNITDTATVSNKINSKVNIDNFLK